MEFIDVCLLNVSSIWLYNEIQSHRMSCYYSRSKASAGKNNAPHMLSIKTRLSHEQLSRLLSHNFYDGRCKSIDSFHRCKYFIRFIQFTREFAINRRWKLWSVVLLYCLCTRAIINCLTVIRIECIKIWNLLI